MPTDGRAGLQRPYDSHAAVLLKLKLEPGHLLSTGLRNDAARGRHVRMLRPEDHLLLRLRLDAVLMHHGRRRQRRSTTFTAQQQDYTHTQSS